MKNKHILFGGLLVVSMVVAACGPTSAQMTATNDDAVETTGVPQTPLGTLDADNLTPTVDPNMTSESMATPEMDMTGTAMVSGTSTMMPAGTTTATANDPLLIRASDLIGLDVAGDTSIQLGTVSEVLIDDSGMVKYVVIDADPDIISGSSTGSNMVAVPMTLLDLQAGYEQLIFRGNEADLRSLETVDVEMFDNDDDFVLGNEAGTPAATTEFNNLIRVSKYTDFDLRNTEDEDLGEVEDLVIDVHAGAVEHTIVNFGGFLGIGEKSVAVPWADLQLMNTTGTSTTAGTDQPYFVLDVPTETLESAPAIDNLDETLPRWPNTINPTWHTEYDSFWQTAGN